jgi:hypothetical protein
MLMRLNTDAELALTFRVTRLLANLAPAWSDYRYRPFGATGGRLCNASRDHDFGL